MVHLRRSVPDSPWPARSTVTTVNRAAKWPTWPSQYRRSQDQPWTNTIAGRPPPYAAYRTGTPSADITSPTRPPRSFPVRRTGAFGPDAGVLMSTSSQPCLRSASNRQAELSPRSWTCRRGCARDTSAVHGGLPLLLVLSGVDRFEGEVGEPL